LGQWLVPPWLPEADDQNRCRSVRTADKGRRRVGLAAPLGRAARLRLARGALRRRAANSPPRVSGTS
jgi:hypothetical protein